MASGGFNLGDIFVTIKAKADDFTSGLKGVESKISGFSDRLKSGVSTAGDTLSSIGTKVALMGAAVGAGFVAMGKSAVMSAGNMEQQRIAFTTLLKDGNKANDALNKIKIDAAKTPFELPGLTQSNMLLISAGVSADRARDDINALGNAIAATGGGDAELSRMAVNLQQIKNVGRATSMDIKQFAFAGIDLMGLLADSMGKTKDEIGKMQDAGKIGYDEITKALSHAAKEGGKFAGAAEAQSKSLFGLMSTVKDTISITLGDLAQKTGLFDAVKTAVAGLGDMLQNTLVPAVDAAMQIMGGKGMGEVMRQLAQQGFNIEKFKPFLRFMEDVKVAFDIVSAAIKGTSLDDFMPPEMQAEWQPFIGIVNGIVSSLKTFGDWVVANKDSIITFLVGAGAALAGLLVVSAVASAIAALTNPITLIVAAIGLLAVAWKNNWGDIQGKTKVAIDAIVNFWNGTLKPAFEALKAGFKVVADFIGRNWDTIKLYFSGAMQYIKGLLQVGWAIISAIFAVFIAGFTGDWGKMWERLKAAGSLALEGLKNMFSGAWNQMKAVALLLWALIKDAVTGKIEEMKARAIEKVNSMKNAITDAIQGIKDFINRVMGGVASALSNPFETAKKTITGIVDTIKQKMGDLNPFQRHSPSLVDLVQMGAARITEAYEGIENSVGGMKLSPTAALGGASAMRAAPSTNTVVNVYNPTVDSDSRLVQMKDQIIREINRKSELSRFGQEQL